MPFTRPTTDIAKEGLFNILRSNRELAGIKTLDLFGGTGCISYELASRGAADLSVVEKDRTMEAFIRKTAGELGIANLKTYRSDVFRFLKGPSGPYDLIFAGPPYALETIDLLPKYIAEGHFLNPGGWFVLEHTPRNHYQQYPLFAAERHYGSTFFSIFINPS
jgi:16S rRNA (guanine(966)-N(2))-methyltransferase RsmD